ncbi:MAG: ester cyclase [bacterium]
MPVEKNRAAHRRLQEEVWKQHKIQVLDELTTEDVKAHFLPPGLPPGREGLKLFVSAYLAAFPDGRNTIEAQLVEGDYSMMRLTFTGTHKGALLNIAATGKSVTIGGMEMWRFTPDGKMAEGWAVFDLLTLMQQIGAIPTPG